MVGEKKKEKRAPIRKAALREIVKKISEISKEEKKIIREMPDHWRRVNLHTEKISELCNLIKISISKKKWVEKKKIFSLVKELISELDEEKGIIKEEVYVGTEFSQLLPDEEKKLEEENLLTLRAYKSLGKSEKMLNSLKNRLAFALVKEKLVREIDLELERLLERFQELTGLMKESMGNEKNILTELQAMKKIRFLEDYSRKLEDICKKLLDILTFTRKTQAEIKEEFYIPFQKFHDEKNSAEEKIEKILAAKKKMFGGEKPVFTFADFMLEYKTITSPQEVQLYFRAIRNYNEDEPGFIDKKVLKFIRRMEDKVIERSKSQRYLQKQKLYKKSIDPLTGAFKRDVLDQEYERLVYLYNPSRRTGEREEKTNRRKLEQRKRVFSLIMTDIDKFKPFNDTYGHLVGDEVLKYVAQQIQASIRRTDVLVRYGGEEFAILLPRTNKEQALAAAEKIRVRIEEKSLKKMDTVNKKFQNLSEEEIRKNITLSLGVASYPDDCGTNTKVEDLIKKADDALLIAKKQDRNRVIGA